jgi:hypothetical protein
MNVFARGFVQFFKSLPELFRVLLRTLRALLPFLRGLWRAIRLCFHRPERNNCCIRIPPDSYKRPDPMLYSQYWLMKQGLSVTWDNPDIQLYDSSDKPVSSSLLDRDTDYKVVVRVWNNSYDAPVHNLPVYLSFLSFGIGLTSTPVGKTYVDLGVKGSAHCPAFADFTWHTPQQEGHYCLQALLVWADDANPENNLGQENTNVGKLHSPAHFDFTVQNEASVHRRFELETDMYRLPELPDCGEETKPTRYRSRLEESRARWARALNAQGYGSFPVTPAWRVTISPSNFDLAAGASRNVSVDIEYMAGTFDGTQAFNIHGFATPPEGQRQLAGGVTLLVEGS